MCWNMQSAGQPQTPDIWRRNRPGRSQFGKARRRPHESPLFTKTKGRQEAKPASRRRAEWRVLDGPLASKVLAAVRSTARRVGTAVTGERLSVCPRVSPQRTIVRSANSKSEFACFTWGAARLRRPLAPQPKKERAVCNKPAASIDLADRGDAQSASFSCNRRRGLLAADMDVFV